MAQRWSFEEDYIVCKYCQEQEYMDIIDWRLDELISRLKQAGYDSRNRNAIERRARDFTYLWRRWEAPYVVAQVKMIYNAFVDMEESDDVYQSIKANIKESYCPDESSTEGVVTVFLPECYGEVNNSLKLIHTIDDHSKFPRVLQKYVELKGVKKYTTLCRGIGMKPDTFSSILRGKYPNVDKDNVLRICVGLELRIDEAEDLLDSAGFSLSRRVMKDVVIRSFLWNRKYSVVAINAELYENGEKILFKNFKIDYDLDD